MDPVENETLATAVGGERRETTKIRQELMEYKKDIEKRGNQCANNNTRKN